MLKSLPEEDFIPVSRPYFWGNEVVYVERAIKDGWISSRGKYINLFEQSFAQKLGVPYAVAVCNGTAALHLALVTLGIGERDEIIVPNFSMISPILAVLYCGATPIPIDADATWNIDPALIEEKLTPRTRAIIAVHTYGHPVNMPPLMEIAKRHGLYVIEDVAEALGATLNGQMAGTFGDMACFSFYANKTITTGEGGMLITSQRDLYTRACWKKDICFGHDNESRFIHQEIGYNYRLTSLQAAFGLAQLEHLAEAVAAKIEIGRHFNAMLQEIPGLSLPPAQSWAQNVYWAYGIVVEGAFGISRAKLQQVLSESGIETRRFFSCVHRQPILKAPPNDTDYPVSNHLADNGLYLPSYIGMSRDTVQRIAQIIATAHERSEAGALS